MAVLPPLPYLLRRRKEAREYPAARALVGGPTVRRDAGEPSERVREWRRRRRLWRSYSLYVRPPSLSSPLLPGSSPRLHSQMGTVAAGSVGEKELL